MFKNLSKQIKGFFHIPYGYQVYVTEYQSRSVEDPHCPSEWRGSGCYDTTEYRRVSHRVFVCASNEKEAEEAVKKYLMTQSIGTFDITTIKRDEQLDGVTNDTEVLEMESFEIEEWSTADKGTPLSDEIQEGVFFEFDHKESLR